MQAVKCARQAASRFNFWEVLERTENQQIHQHNNAQRQHKKRDLLDL